MIKSAGCSKDCKCFKCRLLRAQYAKDYRDRIKAEGKPARDRKHGTRQCYWRGCRRKPCRLAGAKYSREYRGTELRTLKDVEPIVMTSTAHGLAIKAKLSPATILNIKRGRTKRIRQSTERKIVEAGVAA